MEHELNEKQIEKMQQQIDDLVVGLVIVAIFVLFVIAGFCIYEMVT